jgi:hypothetical protein
MLVRGGSLSTVWGNEIRIQAHMCAEGEILPVAAGELVGLAVGTRGDDGC